VSTSSSIAFTYNCVQCEKEVGVRPEDIDDLLVRRSCCSKGCLSKFLDDHSGEEPKPPEKLRELWLNSKDGHIRQTLAELKDEWAKSPHLRLGQLVMNVMSMDKSNTLISDLFNIEDEELINRLKTYSAKFGADSSD